MVYSTDRSKVVVAVLVLLFVALWFILRGDLFHALPCVILFLFFSPFSIAITSLGEEKANLSAFRSICACLDLSVPFSFWCLGRAAIYDCGTPWTLLLPFFAASTPTGDLIHPVEAQKKPSLIYFSDTPSRKHAFILLTP